MVKGNKVIGYKCINCNFKFISHLDTIQSCPICNKINVEIIN